MIRRPPSKRRSAGPFRKRQLLVESLEDRRLLAFTAPVGGEPAHVFAVAGGTIGAPGGTVTETLDTSGHTYPRSLAVLGFHVIGSGGLDPDAVQLSGTGVLNYIVLPDVTGSDNSSLVLARVGAGSIDVTVAGQGGTTGDFDVQVYLPGDDDGSRTIELSDLQAFPARLGSSLGDANYAVEVDSDLNGTIAPNDSISQRLNFGVTVVEPPPVGTPPTAVDDDPLGAAAFIINSGNTLTIIDGAGDIVERNDIVGSPAATISSFGGGSLGGSVIDNFAGTTVPTGGGGTLQVNPNGSFTLVTVPSQAGLFTFDYRLDNGIGTSDATVTVNVIDVTPPTILITDPTAGQDLEIGDTVPFTANASDNVGVTQVEFYVDGALIFTDTTAPYATSFTVPANPKPLPIAALAVDAAGNTATQVINVDPVDLTAPTVAITAPNDGDDVLEGSTVTFTANANDDVAVAQVEFKVNGVTIFTDNTAPYGTSFTVPASPTPLPLQAVAIDTFGNTASASITVDIISASPPTATNDSYASIGNVGIDVPAANGVLANDTLAGGTITAFDSTSANGGTVVLNTADGSFTYDPAPGFTGSGGAADTFTYTLTNGVGSDIGTVSIDVTDTIWFIDDAFGAGGNGTLVQPFDQISDVTGLDPDDVGDTIFVFEGTGTYNGPLDLENNQILIGEGATAPIATIAGITVPTFSRVLPATSGTRPLITDSGSADTIELAVGNTVRGLNVGATGSGVAVGASSSGAITISEVSTTSTGTATGIDIKNSGPASVTFDSVSVSGSSLFNGVELTNNTGTFTFDSLDISTNATGGGLLASNSGTINVTGGGNVISTTTGTAVNITNTTIGGSGVTFQSVSSNGASSGIILNNTGSGGFTITGDGTNAQNGSGGTIANSTSHGILLTNTNGFSASSLDLDSPGDSLAEHGLLATDIGGTNLFRGGRVTGIGHDSGDGIRIANTNTNLTLFEINNTLFNGTTTGGNDGVIVESLGTSVMRVDILNGSEFDSLRGDGVQANSAGTSNLTINLKNSNFNTDNGGADGGLAGGTSRITFISADSSTLTTVVEDNVIDDTGTQFGQLPVSSSIGVLDYIANGSSNLVARIDGNQISGIDQEQAIRVVGDDNAASLDVIINDNDINDIEEEDAIFVYIRDSTQLANISITNNDIGTGPDGGVGGIDNQPIAEHGIELRVQSRNIPPNANDAITANVLISGNDIVNDDANSETIDLESEVDNPDGTASDPGATLNATVTGNNLQNLGGGDELEADSEDGVQTGNLHGRSLLCLNMSGNTLGGGSGTMVVDEDGGTAQDAILNIVQTSQANLASVNGIPTGNVTVAGTPNFSAAACPTPTHGSPLTAAGGQGTGAAAITAAALNGIVDAAIGQLIASGLSTAQLGTLHEVTFAVADLSDGTLGQASGNHVLIDITGAGWGWFVDATPNDNLEFAADGTAVSSGPADGRVDLLTAVLHELGHVLGLDHGDGVMSPTLASSTRGDLDAFFANLD